MDLEETRAFLAVLDHGSFKAAADQLGQPRATLRRRVEALEVRAGATLLVRSRNGVEATPAGQVWASHARTLLRETEAVLAALREVGEPVPRGALRIAAPTTLGAAELGRWLAPLRARFPQLRLQLRRVADPLAEPLDAVDLALVVLAAGEPRPRWSLSPLAALDEGLFASDAYLADRPPPTRLEALADHPLLSLAGVERWPLRAGGWVAIEPSVSCEDVEPLRELTAAGCGIALLPTRLAGGLAPVLAELVGHRRTLAVAVPDALASTPKLRAVVAELQRHRPSCARWPKLHSLADAPLAGARGSGAAA